MAEHGESVNTTVDGAELRVVEMTGEPGDVFLDRYDDAIWAGSRLGMRTRRPALKAGFRTYSTNRSSRYAVSDHGWVVVENRA